MQTSTKQLSAYWQISLLMLLCAVAVVLPDMAYAAAGEEKVISTMLCNVINWFTGSTGRSIATIAIIVIGIGALMGKVSWGMAIIVGIGVALVFGAASIVEALGGSTTACATGIIK
jgi:type IV secretion system protein VirB2